VKTFSQLFLELLEATATKPKPFDTVAFDAMQQKKYGAMMARIAAQTLAASAKKKAAMNAPARQAFPWVTTTKNLPGWWNPDRPWFTFGHATDGYHVTQIVKHPNKFGISKTELVDAAQKHAEKYKEWGGDEKRDGQWVIDQIRTEAIDLSFFVQNLAYSKGWLKVYGGSSVITMEGSSKSSVRAALREIRDFLVSSKPVSIEITFVGKGPGTPKLLHSITDVDNYINSL
jgi:hypothetical protein